MRGFIYRLIVDDSSKNKINRIFNGFITIFILLSVGLVVLNSFEELPESLRKVISIVNIFVIAVFSIEYLFRLCIADKLYPSKYWLLSVIRFVFSIGGIIDLLAILPFFIPALLLDLRVLRLFRLIRFLRIFKLGKTATALRTLKAVFREKKSELLNTGLIAFFMLFLSAVLMYYIEGDVQPDKFGNIGKSMWWAVETLTTVGYGDVCPVTSLGKLISAFVAIVGIGLVAMPTGIISAGYLDKVNLHKPEKFCPYCGENLKP